MHTSCILFPVEVDNLSINISMRGGGGLQQLHVVLRDEAPLPLQLPL